MLAPDGFSRNTVLANGTFPGPTISGFQVIKSLFTSVPSWQHAPQGDNFQINVINQLTDSSMLTDTTIVSMTFVVNDFDVLRMLIHWDFNNSIGTGSFNTEPAGRMVLRSSINVRLYRESLSYTTLIFLIKPVTFNFMVSISTLLTDVRSKVHIGIIVISLLSIAMVWGGLWSCTILWIPTHIYTM